MPLVVEEILELFSTNTDVSSSPQKDSVDVSFSPHKNCNDLFSRFEQQILILEK